MESERKPSPGQWAPWIDDPDPPEEPMSDEQLEKLAEEAKAFLERKRRQQRSSKSKAAPKPANRSAPAGDPKI
jgi:hypothetical protein